MKREKIYFVAAILSLGILLTACGNKKGVTDYSQAEHWLNLPTTTDKAVDVFYLYPTTYSPADQTNPSISTIDDASGKGVYHTFDYPFYYFNLRENAENRTNKYFEKTGIK